MKLTFTSDQRKMRRPLSHRSLQFQSGQALIELAVVLPLLLVLGLGVIEIGRYTYIAILVGNAARAGTAYGAQGVVYSSDTAGITAAANADFQLNGQDVSKLNVGAANQVVTCGCDNGGAVVAAICDPGVNVNAGKCTGGAHWIITLSVTASGTWNSLFNYPAIPANITLSRSSSMRVNQN